MRIITVFARNCPECNKIEFKVTPTTNIENFICPICKKDITKHMENGTDAIRQYNDIVRYCDAQEIRVFEEQ